MFITLYPLATVHCKTALIHNYPRLNTTVMFIRTGTCVCNGEPDCYQLDSDKYAGPKLLFTGSCIYTMLRDDCVVDMGTPTFEIMAKFGRSNVTQDVSSNETQFVSSNVTEVYVNYYAEPYVVSVTS